MIMLAAFCIKLDTGLLLTRRDGAVLIEHYHCTATVCAPLNLAIPEKIRRREILMFLCLDVELTVYSVPRTAYHKVRPAFAFTFGPVR